MHLTTRLKSYAALAAVILATLTSQAIDAAADPNSATIVPLGSVFRTCDFNQPSVSPLLPRLGFGSGMVLIHSMGSTVVAQVRFSNTDQPGGHYGVTLIQLPRPSSSTCGPGDAGTASSGLDLDQSGQAMVTLQDHIRPGATGVWISISQPNPHSQSPAEYYTTQFVVPV
jgi:hypothetical protein